MTKLLNFSLGYFSNTRLSSILFGRSIRRSFSVSSCQYVSPNTPPDASRIRNIGIIAHIDAGKTTTTERMLYYSGVTRRIGDVDDGSTVTDFLPAERARGITIQSAAITFDWPPKLGGGGGATSPINAVENNQLPKSTVTHQINLIDTPGHADFTFEVRRSLRILDGAVCILDGVAGVEAQTEQVWKQAGTWQIPRIVYVNKLDRDGAAFGRTIREVGARLRGWPAVCQIPWWEGGKGRFTGIGDVVKLQGLLYEPGGDGKYVEHYGLSKLDELAPGFASELRKARVALVEILSEYDDVMVEAFLQAEEDHLRITPLQILCSLRRCLLRPNHELIPVFAGASFRNIGVQPLLDAVVDLLPSPTERPDPEISLGQASGNLQQLLRGELVVSKTCSVTHKRKGPDTSRPLVASVSVLEGCALVFKVVNDARRGMLVYIRVYSGSINRNALLYNTNLKVSEKATSLLRMYASDSVPVQSIEAGQIGVIAGSKYARTGDTLIACKGNKPVPPEPLNTLQLRPIEVPPPVFFTSIEPHSLREERDMHEKLSLLLREDPSLQVTMDQDSGQTLLSGMGELHLEIACDRLVNDMKTNASMGKIAIGYRETLNGSSYPVTKIFDKDRSDSKGKAGCEATVAPTHDAPASDSVDATTGSLFVHEQDGNIISVKVPSLDEEGRPFSSDGVTLPPNLQLSDIQAAYLNGALAALSRGPKHSYPMRDTHVTLTLDPATHLFGNDSSISALTSAARIATIAALKDSAAQAGTAMMEPLMEVDITVDEASLGNVVQDISSSRGGHIVSLGDDEMEQATKGDTSGLTIDLRKIYTPPDPFESDASSYRDPSSLGSDLTRTVKAKVPLKEMVGYLKHLRSITGGRGTFVMSIDRFERMTAQREKAVLNELQSL